MDAQQTSIFWALCIVVFALVCIVAWLSAIIPDLREQMKYAEDLARDRDTMQTDRHWEQWHKIDAIANVLGMQRVEAQPAKWVRPEPPV